MDLDDVMKLDQRCKYNHWSINSNNGENKTIYFDAYKKFEHKDFGIANEA